MRGKDITGNRYGKLTAVEQMHMSKNSGYVWRCVCDCGNESLVTIGSLNSGHTQSCGCLVVEGCKKRKTHGFHKNHKTYKSWCKIKQRCYNINDPDYATYGAKGITLHESLHEFIAFYNEVGEPPNNENRWSIDRIDHTKNYEPGNMRWATDFQQARNKGRMKNNSSGFTGVHWEDKIHPCGTNYTTYAVAQWKEYDANGKKLHKKKSFSVKKLGLMVAFANACKYREDQIERLNNLGYGYSENHGKN